jgi:hypothetical protein
MYFYLAIARNVSGIVLSKVEFLAVYLDACIAREANKPSFLAAASEGD